MWAGSEGVGVVRGGGIRLKIVFQPLKIISPTASWIWRCMQVEVWWVRLDPSCLGRTIYTQQCLGAKPPTQFHHMWAERNHPDHYTGSEQPSQFPTSLMPSAKLRSTNLPFLRGFFGVSRSGVWTSASRFPSVDALTTKLRGRSGRGIR